jgi:hypothetical protein
MSITSLLFVRCKRARLFCRMILNSVNVNNLTDLDQPRPRSPEQLTHSSIHITLHYGYTSTLTTNEACFITLTLLLHTPQVRSPAPLCPVCLALVLFQVPCCRSIPEHPMPFSPALALTQMPCLTLPCPSRPLYHLTYSLLPDQQPKSFTNSAWISPAPRINQQHHD